MKSIFALLSSATLLVSAGAKEPVKKTPSTVPGPYPAIIRMTPANEMAGNYQSGIIQSELGGLEMGFLQTVSQSGQEQLALAKLAGKTSGSEQIKAVGEMLESTQATESNEIARLAAAKHVTLRTDAGKALTRELAALSGGKFDKAWVERLIAVNEAGAAAYELGAKSADADIRSFAEKMLPVAKARLQMANRLGGRPATSAPEAPVAPSASEPRAIPPPIAPADKPKP